MLLKAGLALVNRRVGGLEGTPHIQAGNAAVNRRVGGLEDSLDAANWPRVVNRRVGGLEDATLPHKQERMVNRRVGGLEGVSCACSACHMVNRRVGGLEASQANQRPGCCVTQAGSPPGWHAGLGSHGKLPLSHASGGRAHYVGQGCSAARIGRNF